MLLLTLTLIVIWGADVKGQRVYATRSTASTTVTGSPSSSVTNVANCVSGIGNSANQPTATPYTHLAAAGSFGALGGSLGVAFVNLQFDAAVPANTIVFAKVTGGPTATQSSTITGAAYHSSGSLANGSNFYLLAGGDGSQYLAIYATAAFNSIRVTLTAAGSGAVGLPPLESVGLDVHYAYYNTNGSSAPLDCGLAIGTAKGGNGTVDNMQQAVDGNLTTYSTITPAALLSSVDQYFFFSALSNPTDEIKVTLSVPPMPLTLGLANTITVSAFNGSNPNAVWTKTLGTLLSLDLLTLLGNGTPVTTSIKPGVAFDRLTVNSAAVLSLLFSLRVHEVQITAASPVLTVPAPTICANTTTTLTVTASALSTAKWYDAATAGNLLTTGNSFTTPVLTATTTYYVAIAKNGCTEESVRIPVLVTVLPVPVLPAITGTFSTCVGNTTSLANTTAGGSWTSASPAIATVNSTGQVTGVTAGTSLITYSVPNPNGCPSTITTTVTINALPTVNAITGTLSTCVGKTTLLSSTTTLGTWSSTSPAVATVNSSGLVTGISAGTTTISYSLTNGNGCVATQTATVTINPLPTVNAITGTLSACVGKTTTLSNTTTGGVWTSATPAIATVNSSGLVTGVTAGTATINYTVTNVNGCITMVSTNVVIHLQPSIPAISAHHLCLGQAIDLNTLNPADGNGTTGGTYVWSASVGGAALSSTTVSPPLNTTTYYLRYTKDGCFSDSSVLITVTPKPPTPHVILN
ncbi:Ig-like domain-containing protein [Pedobacter gandavensis]|uniref:Ig-like domain-containing protein n=1 Tax=Pedobacter gandavensis TaxID=2679963 RepID=UPI0015FEF23E|nr:Ig-like domain-containing protein [Pedobacter gandavensis]